MTEYIQKQSLFRGDVVDVRSAEEILATLDEQGTLHGVPFMPEMLDMLGKRYRVARRVEHFRSMVTRLAVTNLRSARFQKTMWWSWNMFAVPAYPMELASVDARSFGAKPGCESRRKMPPLVGQETARCWRPACKPVIPQIPNSFFANPVSY